MIKKLLIILVVLLFDFIVIKQVVYSKTDKWQEVRKLIKSNDINIPNKLIDKVKYDKFINDIKQTYIWRDNEERVLIEQLNKWLDGIIVYYKDAGNGDLQVLVRDRKINNNRLSRYWHTRFYNLIPANNRKRFGKLSHGMAELYTQQKLKPKSKYKLSWYEDALFFATFLEHFFKSHKDTGYLFSKLFYKKTYSTSSLGKEFREKIRLHDKASNKLVSLFKVVDFENSLKI